jgi:ferritin-like metal-binding protein YciE
MANELLIDWLNDAYAMEETQLRMLENHIRDAADFPDMQQRLTRHAEETRHHAELMRELLLRREARPQAVKSNLNRFMNQIREWATGTDDDELVKNALADIAAEQFEIASYEALLTAAEDVGDQETVAVCQQILQDEYEMARWLKDHLAGAVLSVFHAVTSANRT